ncbi:MAG: S-layer homology domain-containing protein [Eubacteriales bacterium]|jgi:hypothetical protein
MKKLLAGLLAACMLMVPVSALKGEVIDPEDLPYIEQEDSASSWAVEEIKAAVAEGLVPELTGNPKYKDTITREQFAELVVKMVEVALDTELATAPTGTFTDSNNSQVLKAYHAGIVSGMGDQKFEPTVTTNREQIASMIYRAITYMEEVKGTTYAERNEDLSAYTDANQVSAWALQSMGILTNNNIMAGTSDTTLSPKANCTVEQSIALLYRLYQKVR